MGEARNCELRVVTRMACLRRDLSGKPWGKKLIMTSKGLHSTLSFEDFSVGFGW